MLFMMSLLCVAKSKEQPKLPGCAALSCLQRALR